MHLHRLATFSAVLLLSVTGAACSDDSPDAAPTPTPTPTGATEPTPTPTPTPTLTPEFDSMVVMGHSGVTGRGTAGESMAPENSWATGDNPEVRSLYQRLLESNPALEGHNYNVGVDGARAIELVGQAQEVAALPSVPDLVIIQIGPNDIQCDGSDPENYEVFSATIDEVLTALEQTNPDAQVVFFDHWMTMAHYADLLSQVEGGFSAWGSSGRCAILTSAGLPKPKGIAYLQSIFDGYFAATETACAKHPNCRTDGGGLRATPLLVQDLHPDLLHLALSGQAKEAATAWELLGPLA